MVPICSADRTVIVSYRQAQALGCLICIIPCSAFSFFLNKEQYKEWELKIQVMLSGRIMDLFCTKMPVLLVCLLQLSHGHAAVKSSGDKAQALRLLWVLGREIFPLCCFWQQKSVSEQHTPPTPMSNAEDGSCEINRRHPGFPLNPALLRRSNPSLAPGDL